MIYAQKRKLKIFHLNGISANFCCFIIGDLSPLLPEPVKCVSRLSIHQLFQRFITRWCPMHTWLLISPCLLYLLFQNVCFHFTPFLYIVQPFHPLFVFPFISPNTTSFTSLLSSILQMCPNKFNFLSLILYMMFLLLNILFLIYSFVILCCHHTFSLMLSRLYVTYFFSRPYCSRRHHIRIHQNHPSL